jgi:hypothetical protein
MRRTCEHFQQKHKHKDEIRREAAVFQLDEQIEK